LLSWNNPAVAGYAREEVIGAKIEQLKSYEQYRIPNDSRCIATRRRNMKGIQKIGGYAAVIQGLAFVALLLFIFGFEIPQGLGPGADTAKELAVAARSVIPFLIPNLIVMLLSITIILNTLALRERMQDGAPNRMRLAVLAASISSALFLANGVMSFTGYPPIVALPDTAAAVSAVRALDAVTNGLLLAAIFAAGLNLLLIGWAALSTKGLPALLSYLLLLAGVVAVLSFAVSIFGLVGPVLNVVFSLWLGYVLLTQPATMAAPPKPTI
jgi:hypothetical protein